MSYPDLDRLKDKAYRKGYRDYRRDNYDPPSVPSLFDHFTYSREYVDAQYEIEAAYREGWDDAEAEDN